MSAPLEKNPYRLVLPGRIFDFLQSGVKKYIKHILKIFMYTICFLAGIIDIAYALGGLPGGNGGAEPQGPGAMFQSFLPLILIFVIFYFLLIRPQSKKAKDHKQMLENLKKGDKVVTTGGIHGFVEDLDANTVTLKIGIKDDVRIKVGRSYIAGIRTGE
jgi:preprotein translocase subunit YajC